MQDWDMELIFGLALVMYMFNIFNLNNATCHQTGTPVLQDDPNARVSDILGRFVRKWGHKIGNSTMCK